MSIVKFLAVAVCSGVAAAAYSQQAPPAAPPANAPALAPAEATDAKAGPTQAIYDYFEAFNANDGKKLAEKWTPQGVHVDRQSGRRTVGREALAQDFAALFAESPDSHLIGSVEDVRLIGADAALVDGIAVVQIPGAEPAMTAFSAVLIQQDGKWLLDRVYESSVPTPESPREALDPLAWMVGSWQDESEGADVTTNTRWSAGESFLVRSYNVARDGEEAFSGTQVIGWDPVAKQIRSWMFNSDGSFGEAMWSRSGNEWVVRSVQTLPDGRAASATQIINVVDGDTATVQTIAKEVDGAPEPAAEPVTMKRVAEATAADAAAVEAPAVQAAAGNNPSRATP